MTEPLALFHQTSFRHLESPMTVSRKIPTHRNRHQQTITAELTIRALWRGSLRKLLFDIWRAPWGDPLRTFISLFKSAWHHLDGDHAESISRPKGSTAFREMPPSRSLRGNLPPFVWLSIRDISHSPKLPGGIQHFSISSRQRSSRWSDRAATFAQECLASCLRKPRKFQIRQKGQQHFISIWEFFHHRLACRPPNPSREKYSCSLFRIRDEMAEFIGLVPKSPNKGAEVSKFSSRTLYSQYGFFFLLTSLKGRFYSSWRRSSAKQIPTNNPVLYRFLLVPLPFPHSTTVTSPSLCPCISSHYHHFLTLRGIKRGRGHRETPSHTELYLESRLDLTLSFCKIATWAGEIWGGDEMDLVSFKTPRGKGFLKFNSIIWPLPPFFLSLEEKYERNEKIVKKREKAFHLPNTGRRVSNWSNHFSL